MFNINTYCFYQTALCMLYFTKYTAVVYISTNFVQSDLTAKRECSFRLPKCSGPGGCKSKTSHFSSRKDEGKFAPREIKSGRDTLSVCLGDETTRHTRLSYPLLCVPISCSCIRTCVHDNNYYNRCDEVGLSSTTRLSAYT